ncbi:MAG: DNA mismatch repair protein MutS [Agathobacter sp.]|nr:DNA mismatch repair protein MutS [Agathobacter sp.]
MMQHYLQTKEEYKDCILFYRLGDFYEMFFEDAKIVSKELELTLTGKSCGLEERAPMCGVPFHAADTYINRLVAKGYKVAICEQVEDPKTAKGIVKREVIKIVTPGTNTDMASLDETCNNYIMCITLEDDIYGIATSDVTTGEFLVTEIDSDRKLLDEINRFSPSEIICNEEFNISGFDIADLRDRLNISVSVLDSWFFGEDLAKETLLMHFNTKTLISLGLEDYDAGVIASGALLKYLYETQKNSLNNILDIHPYSIGKYMIIDSSSRRNLELVETMREKQKRGSLLWVLDKTKTAMGARLLRSYVKQPLIDKDEIIKRQDFIEELNSKEICREELRAFLAPIYDLERLITRITYQSANPRDMIAFRNSLQMLPDIKNVLDGLNCDLAEEIKNDFDCLVDLHKLLLDSIQEEPPISVRDGDIIRQGYNEEVDRLRNAKTEGKTWLAELEAKEKESTGIKNLRIKYNKVFGYYLEVTNSFKDLVPDYYVRKQTLTNAERYITPELKELEDTILGSEDRLVSLEYELFRQVRDEIAGNVSRIQKTAHALAALDAFVSLALVASQNNYCRPDINTEGVINIKGGRHPVVEKMITNDLFIDNDTYLDNGNNRISIITGPNMAGKSTYMRQSALIVLMAQIGSFVPATSADIGIVDRIFTRVGASDDLASGQSTFMVEMNEVANILRNATANSLLILDEIGRGTSTFDGLSIAWAVVEHISNPELLGAKTLFATHYHELTELEGKLDNVNNYCIAVKEKGDDIVFLRKIIKGGADKSYGIQVAKLAGLPDSVVERAKVIVNNLLENDITGIVKNISVETIQPQITEVRQLSLFDNDDTNEVLDEIKNLDLANLTPIEALNKLYELQKKAKNC